MKRIILFLWVIVFMTPAGGFAQDRNAILGVSASLVESGILKHILPRFSLKIGVTISVKTLETQDVIPKGLNVVLRETNGELAALVMEGEGHKYYVMAPAGDGIGARFVDWILSDIGQRTIEAYKVKDGAGFRGLAGTDKIEDAVIFDGNAVRGEALSWGNCGRCHVIGAANRMKGLGSTPSFPLLRTFPDWQQRFEAFFTLRPHPSFSQIDGVTEPFDPGLPPPIHPLRISLEQLGDILAYVATISPADLGAPLQHQ